MLLQTTQNSFYARPLVRHVTANDTLPSAHRASVKKQSGVRWNGLFRPTINLDSTGGIALMGTNAVLCLVLGIGFISARSSIVGQVLYPAGIVFTLLGLLFATLFIVHLRRRINAKKASKNGAASQ
jgi:hypothetical protein